MPFPSGFSSLKNDRLKVNLTTNFCTRSFHNIETHPATRHPHAISGIGFTNFPGQNIKSLGAKPCLGNPLRSTCQSLARGLLGRTSGRCHHTGLQELEMAGSGSPLSSSSLVAPPHDHSLQALSAKRAEFLCTLLPIT